MIADLNPKQFLSDVARARWRVDWYSPEKRRWRSISRMWFKLRADKETAAFHRRLAAETDPYMRCALLGQNLSPRGKPALVLEEKWWKWKGYG